MPSSLSPLVIIHPHAVLVAHQLPPLVGWKRARRRRRIPSGACVDRCCYSCMWKNHQRPSMLIINHNHNFLHEAVAIGDPLLPQQNNKKRMRQMLRIILNKHVGCSSLSSLCIGLLPLNNCHDIIRNVMEHN